MIALARYEGDSSVTVVDSFGTLAFLDIARQWCGVSPHGTHDLILSRRLSNWVVRTYANYLTGSGGRVMLTTGGTSRAWEATRIVLGGMYFLGAVAHVALGLLAPEIYPQFAKQALVGVYTELWRSLVVPNLAVLQPMVILLEFGLFAALYWRGRAVLVGHTAGAVFQVSLILSGPWGLINVGLALIHLAALRQSYPMTVAHLIRRLGNEGA